MSTASDPWGRVAEDGTVYCRTADGEREIGSWQAGDTEAAFAHFGRRFDDLSTEVALMESRLASGTGDARKIKSAASLICCSTVCGGPNVPFCHTRAPDFGC